MTEGPQVWRLSKAAKEFNIGINTVVDFLSKKGFKIDNNPNTKIPVEAFDMLVKEFQGEKKLKEAVLKTGLNIAKRETISLEEEKKQHTEELKSKETKVVKEEPLADEKDLFIKDNKSSLVETTLEVAPIQEKEKIAEPKILGKIDLSKIQKDDSKKSKEAKKEEAKKEKEVAEEKAKKEIKAKEQEEVKAKIEPEVKVEQKKEEETLPKVDKQIEQVEKADDAAKQEVRSEEKEVAPKIPEPVKAKEPETNILKVEFKKLEGVTILGKIDLPVEKESSKKPVASSSDPNKSKKRKRKRIRKEKGEESTTTAAANTNVNTNKEPQPKTDNQQEQADKHKKGGKKGHVKKAFIKPEVSEEEISRQIKETLATLSGTGKSKASKYRRQKRDHVQLQREKEFEQSELEKKVLQVTEFIPASELAKMMNVNVNEIISTCMSIGLFISINQRLDAETISIVAEEFGYEVKFVSVDDQESIKEEKDKPEDLMSRAPIVTVMGHVDHGKTSLLDQIRKSNIIAGEAGGITQHIGAYVVELDDKRKITFLDTPGHEAFTAMRARGARVTDVAIIVVAADDSVMPQTIEAINHAQAAGVPIVIAINKIDKPGANVEKVKEELAKINVLVEDWGGKYQSQEISAKNGINIDLLLDKVLLEAELLDLKANPNKNAVGTVIEASLDKGRGYLATILVQAGTLKLGDIVVAGTAHGKIKAMFNERNIRISTAGPSTPAVLLGLDCAPQAGDTFNVVDDEHEARSYTTKRQQIIREQGLRTHKHITLDEIGRRIAIGDFKELNIIVKGDVDGSVEALGDALLKLSTEEVQVNIIHKAVGQITEGDVLLATASNAIIVGFQVRPSLAARKLAEHEQIDIRLYSVIYNAINEIKSAIEGMLSPDIEEKIIANIEIRETFKITKVGTVAGCMVLDGKINRNSTIRVIRDGIVTYTGRLGSLKRFKDDVKEVSAGYECGLNIDRFNDIKVGDIIEAFETIEIARKL